MNFRRIFILTGIISLSVIYAMFWLRMIVTPSERLGSDFMGLYTAARISQSHGFSKIYDIESQLRLQRQEVGFDFHPDQTSYFTHPPFIVPLVRLVTSHDYVASLIRWSVVLLLLNGISTWMLMRMVAPLNFKTGERWILGAATFLFWPTFSGLMNGQDVAVLLLGLSIWAFYLLRDRQLEAGLGLSLITLRPQLALMLGVPFILKHRKVFLGFLLGSAVLVLVSLGLIRSAGLSDYIQILRVVEGGLWYLPHAEDMPSTAGILRRTFETLDPDFFRITIWSMFLAGLVGVSYWWGRKQQDLLETQIGILILLGLLFVPYSHYHELTLLLIPLFCLIRVLSRKDLLSDQNLVLLPFMVSVLLFVGFIGSGFWKFVMVYAVMIVLGCCLLFPEASTRFFGKFPAFRK